MRSWVICVIVVPITVNKVDVPFSYILGAMSGSLSTV